MANLILPRRFNQQPQYPVEVDLSNPLARGLSVVFNAADERELISGNRFTRTASYASGVDENGRYVATSSANTPALTIAAFSPIKSSDGEGSGDLTMLCLANGTNATHSGLMSQRDGASPFTQVNLCINGNISRAGAGRFGAVQYNNTGFDALSNSTVLVDGKRHLYGMHRAASGTMFDLIHDGTSVGYDIGGTSTVVDIYAPGTQEFAIGGIGEYSTGFGALNTRIYLALAYDRLLSSAEHIELYRNPWQIFRAKPRVLYFDVGGGGANEVIGNPIAFEWAVSSASVSESLNTSPVNWEWSHLTGTLAENLTGVPTAWQWETTTGTIEESGFVTDILDTTPIVFQWEQGQASFVTRLETNAGTWSWESGTATVSESLDANAGVFEWETSTATLLGTDEVVANIIPWEWETTTGNLLYVLPQQESGTIGGKPEKRAYKKKAKLPFYDSEQEYESRVQVDEVQVEKPAKKAKVVHISDKASQKKSAKIAEAPLLGDLVQGVQIAPIEVKAIEVTEEDEALIEDIVVSLLLAA